MGGGDEDERVVPRLEMASLPIPDELLTDIFLRLPTPADLARASAACVSFRRVASHRSFLRRYRKLHAPPLIGFLEGRKCFHPAIAPHPSASAASSVALATDFSFSFLPAPACDWELQDIRDGRVLLDRPMGVHNSIVVFPEVVVCDPLHRRYLLLPPITDDLAASMEDPILTNIRPQIFLVPTTDGEEAATADETLFRVIWMAQCKAKIISFVFSSNTGQWRAVPSRRWSDLSSWLPPLTAKILFYSRQYVYGCFYWKTAEYEESRLLVLDIKTMEFSVAKPPLGAHTCFDSAIVEAGEGKPGMFLCHRRGYDGGSDLSYFIRQNDGGSSSQWQKVKTISLDPYTYLICNMEKYLVLYRDQRPQLWAGCFDVLDIETFQRDKVCASGSFIFKVHAYSNFPPSLLSSPTISSGVEKGPEKEMLEKAVQLAQAQSHHGQSSAGANAGDLAVL